MLSSENDTLLLRAKRGLREENAVLERKMRSWRGKRGLREENAVSESETRSLRAKRGLREGIAISEFVMRSQRANRGQKPHLLPISIASSHIFSHLLLLSLLL